jgi:hypothetical protein
MPTYTQSPYINHYSYAGATLSNALLQSNSAMWRWSGHSKRPSFGFIRVLRITSFCCVIGAHSCNFIRLCFVPLCNSFRRLEFSQSFNHYNRTSSSARQLGIKFHSASGFGSRVTSPCRCQVQSIFRVIAISFSWVQLVRCTSTYVINIVPVRSSRLPAVVQCIQPPTLHVNLFAIYTTLFITFRSSYNVLSCHTMLAGATWGIKCDKQALPLRPVF